MVAGLRHFVLSQRKDATRKVAMREDEDEKKKKGYRRSRPAGGRNNATRKEKKTAKYYHAKDEVKAFVKTKRHYAIDVSNGVVSHFFHLYALKFSSFRVSSFRIFSLRIGNY